MKRYLIHLVDVLDPGCDTYYVVTNEEEFQIAEDIDVGDDPVFVELMEELDKNSRTDGFPKMYYNEPDMEFEKSTTVKMV